VICHKCDNERVEASFIVESIKVRLLNNPELSGGDFAILYRTNAQSRPIEDAFIRARIPYKIIGGLRFYDRKEVKDMLAYLKVLVNPLNSVSLKRIINNPKRGIGEQTIGKLESLVYTTNSKNSLWDVINDEVSVKTIAGNKFKAILKFVEMIRGLQEKVSRKVPASEILQCLIEQTGYVRQLKDDGTDEALNRVQNISELQNAMTQYADEEEDSSLESFLESSSLASDLDNLEDESKVVTLMTLHASKGLEFPIVFMVGMEDGLFPSFRSHDDPRALEEERRICYVGITRAKEMLFLTHASSRRLWGNDMDAIPSRFLSELPKDLISGHVLPERKNIGALAQVGQKVIGATYTRKLNQFSNNQNNTKSNPVIRNWKLGQTIIHEKYGIGQIVMIFGTERKQTLAVKFQQQRTSKIVNPLVESIEVVK
jgi:DNA helicase-2/ATP-dependent DNA helicase PcrA